MQMTRPNSLPISVGGSSCEPAICDSIRGFAGPLLTEKPGRANACRSPKTWRLFSG